MTTMRLRFTIRDLLWLVVVVVALVVGWWWEREHHQQDQELLKRLEALDEQLSIQNNNHVKLQAEMDLDHAAEVEALHARLTTAEQQKWFGELPLILSVGPRVILLRACAYAAWEANVAQQRRAWFRIHPVKVEIDISDVAHFHKFSLGDPNLQISWIRLWLGDRLRARVYVLPSTTIADKRTAAALFPEADILEIPRNYR